MAPVARLTAAVGWAVALAGAVLYAPTAAGDDVAPSMYANLITTRMGGLSPEEIALLMSMLDDNGDGELTCAC